MRIHKKLKDNIDTLNTILPIQQSFDFVGKSFSIENHPAYLLYINGMCDENLLQKVCEKLESTPEKELTTTDALLFFLTQQLSFVQISFVDSFEALSASVLSGPCALFIEETQKAVILDLRTYPTRSMQEPESEKISKGAKDGFVETLLVNANLVRRRIRSPQLTFELHTVGTQSRTEIAITYLNGLENQKLREQIAHSLDTLQVTSLTMGAKSLEELMVKKRWYNPLPSIFMTERPDVACSYLSEGHILLLVDNSPLALVLPSTIFQFTQSIDDYDKNPLAGTYFRFIRFLCIPVNLFLLPFFMLLGAYYPQFANKYQIISTQPMGKIRIIFYVIVVEFMLELLRYSASQTGGLFSGSLSIVGGLLIGDMAVNLRWASEEVLFYGAVTMLSSMALSSLEFADGLRIYRLLLLLCTAFFGTAGFIAGIFLILLSVATTPTFGHMSYFWPLIPLEGQALKNLLFRFPTYKAQPEKVWKRATQKRR